MAGPLGDIAEGAGQIFGMGQRAFCGLASSCTGILVLASGVCLSVSHWIMADAIQDTVAFCQADITNCSTSQTSSQQNTAIYLKIAAYATGLLAIATAGYSAKRLGNAAADFGQERRELGGNVRAVRTELDNMEEGQVTLQGQLHAAQAEQERLEQELTTLRDQYARLQEGWHERAGGLEGTLKFAEQTQKTLQGLRTAIDRARSADGRLDTRTAAVNQATSALEERLVTITKTLRDLDEAAEGNEQMIGEAAGELQTIWYTLQTHSGTLVEELTNKLDRAKAEIAGLEAANEILSGNVGNLEEQLEAMNRLLPILEDRGEDLSDLRRALEALKESGDEVGPAPAPPKRTSDEDAMAAALAVLQQGSGAAPAGLPSHGSSSSLVEASPVGSEEYTYTYSYGSSPPAASRRLGASLV